MPPMTLSPREILDRLIGFQSVSSASNLDLIDWVESYLASHGVVSHRVYDDAGTKASLFANVGPEVPGGVVLSGHSDVVPVEGQDWVTDPFTVVEKDGRLYGRGTCDMKGFIALALAAVPLALQARVKRPLQIAISYDEEVGCVGAPPMIAQMVKTLPRAAAVVVGEPSMMRLVNGHKGGHGFSVHVQGFEVHSSLMHTGVNAIMTAARLIDWANQINAENAAKPPSTLAAGFVPHWTTAHVGKISGGTAENITAKDCHFGFGFRVVPGESEADWADRFKAEAARLDAEIKAVRPEAAITLTQTFFVPALVPEDNGAADRLVRRLTGDNGAQVVSYGTEAGQFQAEGYSCVVCGPGDIAQAHQPNEYLEVAQFNEGWAFMQRLVQDLTE
ncbi:acetylornithine deacetylase [Pseudorhodobacter sp.]|uniref:acetylornithine deacetylase n=1 Tax=Pseudorhodobacter sp. TaxID=1934400 RepID=UPI0039E4C8C9